MKFLSHVHALDRLYCCIVQPSVSHFAFTNPRPSFRPSATLATTQVNIVKGEEQTRRLLELIPAENVPKEYGGTADFGVSKAETDLLNHIRAVNKRCEAEAAGKTKAPEMGDPSMGSPKAN